MAWEISNKCRQFPLRENLSFCWQLYILSLLGALVGRLVGLLVGGRCGSCVAARVYYGC